MRLSSPTARRRLHQAYTDCRQQGLPADTLTAFARALFPTPSATWTESQLLFALLWFSLTSLVCVWDSAQRTAFVDLTPLLHTDPPQGAARWIMQCLDSASFIIPDQVDTIRRLILEAIT